MNVFKYDEVNLDEEEVRWFDSVFKASEEDTGSLKSGGGSCLEWLRKLEEEELIEDSNDDLDRFQNVILVESNLDEIRCIKLEYWKEDLEGRFDSSGIIHMEVSDKEEFGISKHVVACEDEECLESRIKVESWVSSWEDNLFKKQDEGSCFLKVWKESFSLKEKLFEG